MSAVPARQVRTDAAARPGRTTEAAGTRRHLHAVATPQPARSLGPFVATCVLIALAAIASVLVVNTQMTQGAFERRDLKIEIANLHQERASLVGQLESLSAPAALAAQAEGMGMVPASSLGFVSIEDSAVLHQGQG
ncbi:hypothetical protein [Demequina sediminicola]|uniref:hypothetical protein n=1 Tax=Demequina sediminicola TaxID=1095026 RepID=UPI0007859D1A|nr:hypothetical protein [Demequina sediminicola]